MKIAHIINPVKVSEKSDLYVAQPVTFASMRAAKEYAAKNNIKVELLTTQYEEDKEIIPDYFQQLPDLQTSVMEFSTFNAKRKLPLIKDILDRAYQASDGSDYMIYTNVDIALMPHFYVYVDSMIKKGYDGLIINRRTISRKHYLPADLVMMYSEAGEKHPGYDCFVFKREYYSKFILGNACIGANWIGRVLYANLLTFSESLFIETEGHLTFHLGDDGAWLTNKFNDFDQFNKTEAYQTIKQLQSSIADTMKIEQLNEVVRFMDKWGKPALPPPRKTLLNRIISRIKKHLL